MSSQKHNSILNTLLQIVMKNLKNLMMSTMMNGLFFVILIPILPLKHNYLPTQLIGVNMQDLYQHIYLGAVLHGYKQVNEPPKTTVHLTIVNLLLSTFPHLTQNSVLHTISYVCHHHDEKMINSNTPPLFMIVCGTAGTGKSYLIHAIAHALGNLCLLTATTGMASYNIAGKTLHSALHLPIHHFTMCDLQGASLQRL